MKHRNYLQSTYFSQAIQQLDRLYLLRSTSIMTTAQLRGSIVKCLLEVRSSTSVDDRQKALQTLDSITKVSPQNRNLLANTDGAVFTLVSFITSSSPVLQTLSLSVLFNLSLNPGLKHLLADMDTLCLLNAVLLSPQSPDANRLAGSLVCSLAMHDKNKAKFGVAGTIQILIQAISKSTHPPCTPAAHHLLSSLAELVQFHGNCTLAVRAGAINVLLGVINNNEGEDLAGTSLAALALLSRFDEGLNALIKTEDIVNSMIDVLKGRCTMSKEGAAEILIRLFDESEGCLRDALRIPEVSNLLADLSVRGSLKARDKSCRLMKKLVEANFDSHSEGDNNFSFY